MNLRAWQAGFSEIRNMENDTHPIKFVWEMQQRNTCLKTISWQIPSLHLES